MRFRVGGVSRGSVMKPYLVPGVQQHDVRLVQVVLCELRHFGYDELSCFIRALKQTGLVVRHVLLQPALENKHPFIKYTTSLFLLVFVSLFHRETEIIWVRNLTPHHFQLTADY